MALSRDFAAKMLFWAVVVVAVLMGLGCFTPRENRISQKSASPEWSAVTGGTSRDKQATSPKKPQSQPSVQTRSVPRYSIRDVKDGVADIRANYGHFIHEASMAQGISPRVIEAIIFIESGGDKFAAHKEKDGEFSRGLMQVKEGTVRKCGINDPFNPYKNISCGVTTLAEYRGMHPKNDLDYALAAYNNGPGTVNRLIREKGFDPSRSDYTLRVKEVVRIIG